MAGVPQEMGRGMVAGVRVKERGRGTGARGKVRPAEARVIGCCWLWG